MELFCIIFASLIGCLHASLFSMFTGWGSRRSTEITSSTTALPSSTTTPGSPGRDSLDLEDFYILEHDGRFRSQSPSRRQQNSDLDFVDRTKVLDDGAFVFIENDTTALVFDGMEVRELHFADLSPVESAESLANTTLPPGSRTSDGHAHGVSSTSNTSTIEPSVVHAEGLTFTTTISPPKEPVRPEVQEFLARIRYSGLGFRTTHRLGITRTLPVGAVPLLYQSLLTGGMILPLRNQPSLAWMPSVGGTTPRESNQFEDSYYTREELEPVPLSPTPPPLSPGRHPHLFYLRRQTGVDSSTTSPHV